MKIDRRGISKTTTVKKRANKGSKGLRAKRLNVFVKKLSKRLIVFIILEAGTDS